MKGFAFALLCIAVAVQARNLDVEVSSTPALSGENPWVVHLRIASSTGGGRVHTCVGSLISPSWVLTSASCVQTARFIWLRYGAVDPIRPELVTETSTVRLNPDFNAGTGENNVALVSINRVVDFTDNIRAVPLAAAGAELPSAGRFCGYGGKDNVPGEQLKCFEASLETAEDGTIVAKGEDGQATEFDIGAPLVSEGVQYGVLISAATGGDVFLNPAKYRDWIRDVANV